MSKFKVGDIVSPNVVEYWTKDWPTAEVIGFDNLWARIKNDNGDIGSIFNERIWDVIKPKKEETMPKIEVGSKWTDGEFVVTVVYVSDGDNSTVFFVYNDGSGEAFLIDNFFASFKPVKKTITKWTYVYRDMDSDELEIDSEIFETEEDAIDDAKIVLCRELIKTLKIEYTEE